MPIDVFLTHAPQYGWPELATTVGSLLERCGCRPAPGTRVLVKPNLVAPFNAALTCTHPAVLRAACAYLADCGTKVSVGDSPAFGTAKTVASRGGHVQALKGLPVQLVNFSSPRQIPLSLGGSIGVARAALEAELLVNIPRFKVHDQMLLTLAVKNTFGCVIGFRKAWAHQTHGEKGNRFESMLLDVHLAMPPMVHLMDGILAMHRCGPAKGNAYPLGLLGASASAVALDTALYALLGLDCADVPLGQEALARKLPGATLTEAAFPLSAPGDFAVPGFELPRALAPVAFKPSRFFTGRMKSLYVRLCGLCGERKTQGERKNTVQP